MALLPRLASLPPFPDFQVSRRKGRVGGEAAAVNSRNPPRGTFARGGGRSGRSGRRQGYRHGGQIDRPRPVVHPDAGQSLPITGLGPPTPARWRRARNVGHVKEPCVIVPRCEMHPGSCLAARGHLPARHMRSCSEAVAHAICGRLRQRAPLSSNRRAQVGQRPIARRSRTSASSWQDLLLGPGGAPMPPGCLVAQDPRAPHPVPPHGASRNALNWTRWTQCKGDLARGDCLGIHTPLASSRRKPGSRATGTKRAALDTGFRRWTELGAGSPRVI